MPEGASCWRLGPERLQPLPPRRADDFEEELVNVTRNGGFIVRHVFYTAPSQLI